MERKCIECPAFFEVKDEGLIPTGGGWSNKTIDGKDVICCRPGKTLQKKKPMELFCFYCLATVKSKKIGHKASWTGRTPPWCPLGREEKQHKRFPNGNAKQIQQKGEKTMSNYIRINNQRIDLTDEQVEKIKDSFGIPVCGIKLADEPVGETVRIGDHEMIVLEHCGNATLLLRKDLLHESREFGTNNNYDGSYVDVICQDFAKEIAAIVGEDNILLHDVDLTSDDGLKDYGTIQRYASLLTTEQARQYVQILDKYKLDAWWWLATAWSAPTHDDSAWVKCVSPSGYLNYNHYLYDDGVRPFCILKSDIFVSK